MNQPWPGDRRQARQTPDLVPAMLRAYGDATALEVERILGDAGPAPFLGELVADYPRRGGKRMRPALFLAASRAHGAALEEVLPCAAGIELFHNALLIHDDIEDESETRRGKPTLHRLHGVPLALNAGDALLMLALAPIVETATRFGHRTAALILRQTRIMAAETAEGQALELGWRDQPSLPLSMADYLTMVLKKTAWLATIWPLQLGLLVGSRGRADPERVARFGFFLGAAFQIQDDLLNYVADAAYGKERHGDLFEGKRTLMLIHARAQADPGEAEEIDRFLARRRQDRTAAEVARISRIIEHHGSRDHALAVASALAGAAAHEFTRAFGDLPASDDLAFLEGMIPWVFERV